MSNAFALVTEAALTLLGNQLKFKEALSARLGDIVSHLYMGSAVLKHYQNQDCPSAQLPFVEWAMDYCLYQVQLAFEGIFENFPSKALAKVLKVVIFPWGKAYRYPQDQLSLNVAAALQKDTALRDQVTGDIFVGGETDNSGQIDATFKLLCECEPLLKKLTQASKQGRISRNLPLSQKAQAAFEQKILSDEEKMRLLKLDDSVWQALQVDEFGVMNSEGIQHDQLSKKTA
jgi:hypothetical protein